VELAKRYSYEDLMRAFDVLARAEADIRGAAQPRYHLEMALLRWIYLRKLVPLADLLAGLESGSPRITLAPPSPRPAPPAAPPRPSQPPTPMAGTGRDAAPPDPGSPPSSPPSPARPAASSPPAAAGRARDPRPASRGSGSDAAPGTDFKDAFLAQIRQEKKFFYGTVVAQAHRIDVGADAVTFSFAPAHRALRAQFEQNRPWLEGVAATVAGRRIAVASSEVAAAASGGTRTAVEDRPAQEGEDLRAKAMENEGVQALLDVFGGADIKEIEEIE
jgi:DNA polymerase-3 subunit gamma/tau